MNQADKKLILKVMARQSKIQKNFPYSMLGIVLPQKNLLEFISVFGGMTIKVPTLEEITCLTKACAIYELGGYEKAEIICKELTNGISKKRYTAIVAKFN
jgi:hypothetical protein